MFTSQEYSRIGPSLLGMDPLWKEIKTITSEAASPKYPPHNVIKTKDGYLVEMAVEGWKIEDLTVTVENKKLRVSGNTDAAEEDREYAYRGIGKRAFDRSFILGNDLEVTGSSLKDGILSISMLSTLPEPKKIAIMNGKTDSKLLE